MEWKKGITKETREKREGNYSDLERLSMIRSDVAVTCGKRGTERKTRGDEAASERASRRKAASVSVICAKEAREASGT